MTSINRYCGVCGKNTPTYFMLSVNSIMSDNEIDNTGKPTFFNLQRTEDDKIYCKRDHEVPVDYCEGDNCNKKLSGNSLIFNGKILCNLCRVGKESDFKNVS